MFFQWFKIIVDIFSFILMFFSKHFNVSENIMVDNFRFILMFFPQIFNLIKNHYGEIVLYWKKIEIVK